MTLFARLTFAFVALVVATAGAVGFLTYHNLSGIAVPRSLVRADIHARAIANDIANIVASSRADVKGFRRVIGLDEVMTLSLDPSLERASGQTFAEWRARIERRFATEMEAKPQYILFRIIKTADDGRELIRVRRPATGGPPRIAPENELQRRSDREFFQKTVTAPDGTIVISSVELNRENGVIETPNVPVVRISTPLYAPDGKLFGMLVVNVDLRITFGQFDEPPNPDTAVYVVNDQGHYLLNPEHGREFGFRLGKPYRIQDDFPGLAPAISSGAPRSGLFENLNGKRFGVSVQSVKLSEGPRISVIETMPESSILAAAGMAVQNSLLVGGLTAALLAGLVGAFLARTFTRPLSQTTAAVAGFTFDKPLAVPVAASGEIGVLANAFDKMARDVREKTNAIRHDKEIFETIMSTMADAVFMVDTSGNVIYQNAAAKKLLHHHTDTSAGTPFKESQDVFEPDGVTPIAPENWPSIRCTRGDYEELFELMLRPHGTTALRDVLGSARPIRDAFGKIVGAVVVCRDVTDAKKLEHQLRQSQKLDAIGQLTGGIAHDFNNTLTVITGTIEILTEGVADRPDLHAIAKLIDQAADRGADLTKHLLAFARKQPLQPHNVDINAMVTETAQLLRPTLGEHIEIESKLARDADFALIDPSQLSTALLNLAVNARDAMPNGGKLTLETGNVILDEAYAQANAEVRAGPYVMVAVSDTGTGIPASIVDKVFEPFFTTKDVGKGTGLGLSMVYGLVKQSNGHIKIYSEEGYGTTIKLYLPRGTAKLEVAQTAAPLSGGHETILVVEDDDMVRNFLVTQLHSLGYRTMTASSGPAALAKVHGGAAFDLLFTDVIMPGGLNGRQLADEVVKLRPGMKVLFTSGYTENAIIHHGRLDPGVLLLAKPYRKADLARMLRQALQSPGIVQNTVAGNRVSTIGGLV